MRKISILAGFVTCVAFATSNPALSQPIEPDITTRNGYYQYSGSLIITSFTPATAANCARLGFGVGGSFTLRFSPPNVGFNGANWRMSVFYRQFAEHYHYVQGAFPKAIPSPASYSDHIGAGFGPFFVTPQVAIALQSPATITTNTFAVYLQGTIRNFGNNATTSLAQGCDINFRFSGVLAP